MTDRVLEIGGLTVTVKERPSRSTMELIVERDGSLVVMVPSGIADSPVEEFIDRKQDWIYRKLLEKADFLPVLPPKELVNGEGFKYLGRNCRLLLVDSQDTPVKLVGGRLCLLRDVPDGGRALRSWYKSTGTAWLRQRVNLWADRCEVPRVQVAVRDLGYRWGSFSSMGHLNIHWAALQLGPRLIDYVLVHELVHGHIPDHGQPFWRKVSRVMPDYEQRRLHVTAEGAKIWLGGVLTP